MTDKFHDTWRASVRAAILHALDRVSGRSLLESNLFANSNQHLRLSGVRAADVQEFAAELETLRLMGCVVIVSPGRLMSEQKVMITQEGRLALAEVQEGSE